MYSYNLLDMNVDSFTKNIVNVLEHINEILYENLPSDHYKTVLKNQERFELININSDKTHFCKYM